MQSTHAVPRVVPGQWSCTECRFRGTHNPGISAAACSRSSQVPKPSWLPSAFRRKSKFHSRHPLLHLLILPFPVSVYAHAVPSISNSLPHILAAENFQAHSATPQDTGAPQSRHSAAWPEERGQTDASGLHSSGVSGSGSRAHVWGGPTQGTGRGIRPL